MWQEIIVAMSVLSALLFLLQRYVPAFHFFGFKKTASCEGCSSCGKEKKCT